MNLDVWTSILKDPRITVDIEYQPPVEIKYEIEARDRATIDYVRQVGRVLTMDNGGHPFLVTFHSTFLRVYSKHIGPTWDTSQLLDYSRPTENLKGLVLMTELPLRETDTVFVGDGAYEDHGHHPLFVGNAVLVARQSCVNTIISISIETFTTSEPIIDFKSTVCNSFVAYGFALSKNRLISIGPIGCFGYYEQPRDAVNYDDSSFMICRTMSGIIWSKSEIDHDTIVPRI